MITCTKQFDFFITLPGRPHCQVSLVSYSLNYGKAPVPDQYRGFALYKIKKVYYYKHIRTYNVLGV